MNSAPESVDEQVALLQERWAEYRDGGKFDQFVEYTLSLNSLGSRLASLRLPGLVRQCEGLENAALALFGDVNTHPVAEHQMSALQRQFDSLLASIASMRRPNQAEEQRGSDNAGPRAPVEWIKPRLVWIITAEKNGWLHSITEQLGHFGFEVRHADWGAPLPEDDPPFVVLFVPQDQEVGIPSCFALDEVTRVRRHWAASPFFYASVPLSMDCMVALIRAGIDVTLPRDEPISHLLARVIDLVQAQEQERYQVLVVEDSRVAMAQIQRALNQHGIESRSVPTPEALFDVLEDYRPDLILMDMYMPGCNGVEATRALRQLPAWQAVPIVYLSGETDVGLQVEALRLGGDQFLTKPFNPVLLAATVKTTIERHREMQRAGRHDGLTGLLNHVSVKSELEARLANLPPGGRLSVAMIDIDHFKSVNDTHGHPVGDQVIRNLAWLMKSRLRTTDLIGRYGGEEFLVALGDADESEAWAVLDRMRAAFAALPHALTKGTLMASFSAGIASYPAQVTVSELIQTADDALLEAKRRGRNQVVCSVTPCLG